MARTKPSSIRSARDAIRTVSEGIKSQLARPNIYGYVPHPKQVEFHSSTAHKKLFIGGNRSGKTVGGVTEDIWWLTGKHPYIQTPKPPVRGRLVSVDFLNGVEKIVKPEVARWLPASELLGGSWDKAYNKELRVLTLRNGSTLEFMSYDQDVDKFAGTSRHFIHFDEEPPRDIYIECLQRLIDTGGSFWMTLTPIDGMSSWIYDDLYMQSKEDTNIKCVTVDMEDNPHINWGEANILLSSLTPEEIRIRKSGQFVQIGGLVYKMFDVNKHVIDELDLTMVKDWLHIAAMDHGFTNPTAWLWGCVDGDGRIIIYDEYYVSGKIIREHAQAVHEINQRHGFVPEYNVGDPSIRNTDPITGTSVHLEYVEYGVPIVLGNNDQKAGINRVARYLTGVNGVPQLYITRNCVNLIREVGRLRWAQWANKKVRADKNPKEEQHKKDDHAADALRYFVASRPELDTATQVPTQTANHVGASTAIVNPDELIDKELQDITVGSSFRSVHDDHLGDEF